jgi:uncharacterized delta-60 repeat protein
MLVVAGKVWGPGYGFSDAFVSRFDPGGAPDPAFGYGGSARAYIGILNGANAVALQPDGKIVIAGYSAFNDQYTVMDFLIARFNPDGSPDAAFGNDGAYLVDFAGGADSATALALAPDGKLVVAGSVWTGATYAWGVARLTPAGQPDTTFGTNGWVANLSGNSASADAILIQPDGKILLGGAHNRDFLLHRLLDGGGFDTAFGTHGGFTLTDLGGTDGVAALALAPDGRIYAAGYRIRNNQADMALAQYTPEGRLATCADPGNCPHWPAGTFFVDQGSTDYAYALDLRGDGQLVAAGCINQHFAAVQVGTDGPPSPLFFHTDFVGYPDCARGVKFAGQDRIVIAGNQGLHPFSGDDNIALARFMTTPDTSAPTPTPDPSPYQLFLPTVVQ